jgi:TolB protein
VVSRAGAFEHAIWVMNADGTGFKRLTSELYDNNDPEFTPDGEHIVFDSQKGALVSAIWIMNADGSNKRRLTPAKLEAGLPDVSPDGQNIAFINHFNTSKPTAIFSMNIDGTGIMQLTHLDCCHHEAFPKYWPDGTKIVFTTNRNYPSLDGTDIYKMNRNGSNQLQITTNVTLGGCPDSFYCVFPDWGPRASG